MKKTMLAAAALSLAASAAKSPKARAALDAHLAFMRQIGLLK